MAEGIPSGSVRYELSASYNQHTIPRAWTRLAPLAEGCWAKIVVQRGELDLTLDGAKGVQRLTPGTEPVVPPGTPFQLAPRGPVVFHLEYYRAARLSDADSIAAALSRG